MRLQNSTYYWDDVIWNQRNCRIVLNLRMTLFSTNEIAWSVAFRGWPYFQSIISQDSSYLGKVVYFQPMRLHVSSYIAFDVIFNLWYCGIRRILGLRLFSTNEIEELVVFWVWRYLEPMELLDCNNFEDDVIFNQGNCMIGLISGMTLFSIKKLARLIVLGYFLYFKRVY